MEENSPIGLAFCPLLFLENGGTFTENGKPVFGNEDQFIRGTCGEAFDCLECPLLRKWQSQLLQEGHQIGWECFQCLKVTKSVPRWLPGYYQSSNFSGPLEDRVQVSVGRPLDGCTQCGFGSSYLQLVIRKP